MELDRVREVKELIEQLRQLESGQMVRMSSRLDQESNRKEIITIPPPMPPTPPRIETPVIPLPREPGPISPYYSRVMIPEDSEPSRGSRLRSSLA